MSLSLPLKEMALQQQKICCVRFEFLSATRSWMWHRVVCRIVSDIRRVVHIPDPNLYQELLTTHNQLWPAIGKHLDLMAGTEYTAST